MGLHRGRNAAPGGTGTWGPVAGDASPGGTDTRGRAVVLASRAWALENQPGPRLAMRRGQGDAVLPSSPGGY